MVSHFNSRYVLPSRSYFAQSAIPNLYTEVWERIEQQLAKEAVFFSATTDLWTSGSCDLYITFTVHYIDKLQLQSHCLCTAYLVEDHTGENIKESLLDTLHECNFCETKVAAVTTDSGSNISMPVHFSNGEGSCFSHNCDLAINNDSRTYQGSQSLSTGGCQIQGTLH